MYPSLVSVSFQKEHDNHFIKEWLQMAEEANIENDRFNLLAAYAKSLG